MRSRRLICEYVCAGRKTRNICVRILTKLSALTSFGTQLQWLEVWHGGNELVKGKRSSLDIAPLTILDSGTLQPRKWQLIGTGCSTAAQASGYP